MIKLCKKLKILFNSKNKMSYKVSAKNRRLKRTLMAVINFLKFEWLNIDTSRKIVFIWVLFWIWSLFLNWTDSFDEKHVWNAFKNILWINWYILFALNIKIIFIIFSQKLKELIKSFFNFNAKDGIIILFLASFWLILTINTVFVIENFNYFTAWIFTWKWIIFSIIWYTFSILWWIIMLKTKTKTSVYMEWKNKNDLHNSTSIDNTEKNNMKLPF